MEVNQIINGCKSNDRKCQRAFVDQFSPYLFGVCRRYISDEEKAKDCLQEALVHILSNIKKYKATGSFKSWAARVTATQCLQMIRREKRHITVDIENSAEPSEEESISDRLEVEDIMKFLETIPERYRIAVNMYIIEGYSHKEIAQHLEITESSSRSLVTRARKMIVSAFGDRKMKIVHKKYSDRSQPLYRLNPLSVRK
ncbi:MAG: sigma-70 family RNA polymerase sigma factor [Saprospiraceae bacterium]|nr:sigma-70 family RNA polymerase sigma factor [Saprospiraceae bacterium]